jgi:hypothetical protein
MTIVLIESKSISSSRTKLVNIVFTAKCTFQRTTKEEVLLQVQAEYASDFNVPPKMIQQLYNKKKKKAATGALYRSAAAFPITAERKGNAIAQARVLA